MQQIINSNGAKMKLYSDNALSRYKGSAVAAMLGLCFCSFAMAGVDDVWNAAPPTYDTAWAQQYAGNVIPSDSSTSGRVDLYNGSTTTVSVSVPSTVSMLYVSFDLDGRGITQVAFDLQEAVARGNVRIYNRGGENADRPYDGLINVRQSGSIVTLQGQGIWTGAPVIKRVVGYSL
ncbi:hypothetical protein [Aeromonas hydrophila]